MRSGNAAPVLEGTSCSGSLGSAGNPGPALPIAGRARPASHTRTHVHKPTHKHASAPLHTPTSIAAYVHPSFTASIPHNPILRHRGYVHVQAKVHGESTAPSGRRSRSCEYMC
eukprot:6188436-Pleurochrysis_carterae.AAC.1